MYSLFGHDVGSRLVYGGQVWPHDRECDQLCSENDGVEAEGGDESGRRCALGVVDTDSAVRPGCGVNELSVCSMTSEKGKWGAYMSGQQRQQREEDGEVGGSAKSANEKENNKTDWR